MRYIAYAMSRKNRSLRRLARVVTVIRGEELLAASTMRKPSVLFGIYEYKLAPDPPPGSSLPHYSIAFPSIVAPSRAVSSASGPNIS